MSNELLLSNYDIHELVAQHERTGDRRNAAFFVACEVRDRYEATLNELRTETIPEPVRDQIAKLYGANEQLRAEVRTLHSHLAQVRIRLAQLEAEAERNRGEL